jgi:outer membrane protein TolC
MRELVSPCALLLRRRAAHGEPPPAAPHPHPRLLSTAEPAPSRRLPAQKVTLADAVKRALDRNPTVAVAVKEIDRADALIKQSRAAWYRSST